MLKESDIEKMSKLLHRNQVRQNLDYLFFPENIYINLKFKGKFDVFKFAFSKLSHGKYVTDEFFTTLLNRERIGSTYIGNRVAVVHGDMNEVIDNCLQVMRLSEPLLWEDQNYVDIIINIVSTKDDSIYFSKIFRKMGERLDDKVFWSKLREAENEEKLAELLNWEFG